jgi:hypothetical protein
VTVISMVPLKFSGAEMKVLSASIPGSDQRIAPNAAPAENVVLSLNPLRTGISVKIILRSSTVDRGENDGTPIARIKPKRVGSEFCSLIDGSRRKPKRE